ncbi:MAG: LUD domain-containing protein [Candidatus Aminicenantes bacterium]|nr:LUD domain-containing protein [Candidatus Aminicenantes bacterium]
MLFSKKKKKVKKALQNETLQTALSRASSRHAEKFTQTREEIPWEEYKEKARAIKEECVRKLPQLLERFVREAEKSGSHVTLADTPEKALETIENILSQKKAKLIVKSKSMVSEEIHLNEYLEKKGYRVVETDLGEWIIQLAGEKPSHITAPALHKTREEIADLLSRHLKQDVPADPEKMVKLARLELRHEFIQADAGISGANFAVAESGTLVILSNEGNARLATSLPPVHIALVTTEKFVETLEQAVTLTKTLTIASSGSKLTAYVSFITGPSRTTDIEKEMVTGVHGPQEVHIIILDNGRLKIREDKELQKILHCLKCGGCMLVCPVFQSLGGHLYGGPVYPGGIGLLLTAVTRSHKEAAALTDFCADCKKCEEFCPVGIPTGDLLLKLKKEKGPKLWETAISRLFTNNFIMNRGARVLSLLQRPWEKNGFLKKLPIPRAKEKNYPALRPQKSQADTMVADSPKILLFEGCLTRLFFPGIRESAKNTLAALGYSVIVPSGQDCCGAPSLHLGREKDVKTLARKNTALFEKEKPDYIITVCPTGNAMLKKTYPKLLAESKKWTGKIFDFTEFMVLKGHLPRKGTKSGKVFYHIPCHTMNELKMKEEPLKALRSLGFSIAQEEEPATCCGFCGVFNLKNPEIADRIWEKKKSRIQKSGAKMVATDCPGCLFQIKSNLDPDNGIKVCHTAELFAEASD